MPLQFKNIAVGNLQDDVSGNNYAANKAVYILNLNNTLAQIFSDEEGTIPIVQDGVNNVTGARGVFGFWVEAGDYFVQVGANKYRVSITGADYFNNRIGETVNLIVDAVAGRGAYYVAGSFEVGFTYTDINQVGTFGGTDYYIYTGGLTNLPHNVTAGTNPTLSSDYAQVFYGEIDNVQGLRDELNDRAKHKTYSQIITEDAPVGTRYIITDLNNPIYEVVDISDTGGFYLALNASKKLKYILKNGIAYMSHTAANNVTDSAEILQKMAAAGFRTINVDIEVLCETGGYVIPETLTITGDGKFIVDWSKIGYGTLGNEVFVYNFTGDKVLYKHVDSVGINYPAVFVEQEFTSFLLFTGDRSKVRHTDGSGHPNYTFSIMSETGKFDFISNTGEGQLPVSTEQTAVHCLLYQRNGSNSVHSHNEGERYSNIILHGLSPQKSTVNYNIGRDCGEHVFYGSSSDYCHAQGNEAYGDNTSFKIRGDYNVALNNIIEGGSFSLTNRVADTGNGFAMNKVTSIGNIVTCRKENAIAYRIASRTGFDGPVRDIVSIGNTINAFYTGSNAHLIIFESIRYVQCSDDVVCSNTITDGIRISPTDGVTASKVEKIQIDSSKSIGASNQAYQLTGAVITMNNFAAESGGGSGASSGCVLISTGRFAGSLFELNYSDNTYGFNFIGVTTATLDNGIIERPSGGTLPHVFNSSGGGTVTEGNLITKIN